MQEYNFPKVEESRGVVDMLDRFNTQRAVSRVNVTNGRVVVRAFKRFLIFKGCPDMDIDQVTADTLREFV